MQRLRSKKKSGLQKLRLRLLRRRRGRMRKRRRERRMAGRTRTRTKKVGRVEIARHHVGKENAQAHLARRSERKQRRLSSGHVNRCDNTRQTRRK